MSAAVLEDTSSLAEVEAGLAQPAGEGSLQMASAVGRVQELGVLGRS